MLLFGLALALAAAGVCILRFSLKRGFFAFSGVGPRLRLKAQASTGPPRAFHRQLRWLANPSRRTIVAPESRALAGPHASVPTATPSRDDGWLRRGHLPIRR